MQQQRRSRDLVREVCFLGGELKTLWPMAGGSGSDAGTQYQVRRNLQTRGVVSGNHCRRVRASQGFIQQIKVRVADLGVLPLCLLGEDYQVPRFKT
jgi:hypothetical protein